MSRRCGSACASIMMWWRASRPSRRLFESNDKPDRESLGGLRADAAETLPDDLFDAEHFRLRDPRYVAIGDLERLAVHQPVGDRPSQEPVVRIDSREALGELALQLGDRFSRREHCAASPRGLAA